MTFFDFAEAHPVLVTFWLLLAVVAIASLVGGRR